MAHFTARRKLATVLTRTLSSSSSSSFSTLSSRSRFAVPLIDKLSSTRTGLGPCYIPTRPKTSGSGYSPLNDPSPNWSNRPPKETILLDGCDYEHWLIVMEFTDPKPTEDEMISAYVKTLTSVVGRQVPCDLYIEGKVIPRPQYRFTEQRQTRNRSRPRYDRRRETMQVERREPTQQNWNQNQPPPPMGHQAPEN
ncbi:hypothetical protein Bca4012_055490 [Brassica carinata]